MIFVWSHWKPRSAKQPLRSAPASRTATTRAMVLVMAASTDLRSRCSAPPAFEERDGRRRGVVTRELTVGEELEREARQVERVALAVRGRADGEERDAL